MCLPMSQFIRNVCGTTAIALLFSVSAPSFAQTSPAEPIAPQQDEDREIVPDVIPDRIAPPEEVPLPEAVPLDELKRLGLSEGPFDTDTQEEGEDLAETKIEKPDYSHLPESEERVVRLDALFERLQAEENAESANLIAEEVWAIWLDSGSASVDMLLRRGTAAQKRGDRRLARRMYNHVIELSPEYAEGWARSARLALEEDDLSRALSEATQALILEPRQFYAHWTLGNIFEKIGRTEPAYEVYKEANRLYPQLLPLKDRLEMMKGSIEGDVL